MDKLLAFVDLAGSSIAPTGMPRTRWQERFPVPEGNFHILRGLRAFAYTARIQAEIQRIQESRELDAASWGIGTLRP